MPNPPIVGVHVHFNDTRLPVLHERGRSWHAHLEDGVLGVYDEHDDRIASHAALEWAWVELVHGEDEPAIENLTVGRLTFGGITAVPADPVEQAKHQAADRIGEARIKAAEKAVADARKKQADAAVALAMDVMDAEDALAALRRELGEAA